MLNKKNKILISLTIIICSFYLYFNLTHTYWTDGDEPHYMVVADSIFNDRDINLNNNYNEITYRTFRGDKLNGEHITIDKEGNFKPFHGILPSILYSSGFLFTNITGTYKAKIAIKIDRIIQLIIFVIGFWLTYDNLKKIFGVKNKNEYLISILVALISPTLALYSTVLFPDMIQGVGLLFTCMAVYSYHKIITLEKINVSIQDYIILFIGGIVTGLNIFVHYKTIISSFLIVFSYLVYQYILNKKIYIKKDAGFFVFPVILFVFLHMLMTYSWYGLISFASIQGFTPEQGYKGGITSLFPNNAAVGIAGLLLDLDKGILFTSPLLLCYLLGFKDWVKNNRLSFVIFGIPSLISIMLYSCYMEWWAGYAPAGRYLIPFMFSLFPSFYFGFKFLWNIIIGKIYIILSTISSILFFYTFNLEPSNRGFMTLDDKNVFYRVLNDKLNLIDLNKYLRFLDFENKQFFSYYGLLGFVIISLIITQIVKGIDFKKIVLE